MFTNNILCLQCKLPHMFTNNNWDQLGRRVINTMYCTLDFSINHLRLFPKTVQLLLTVNPKLPCIVYTCGNKIGFMFTAYHCSFNLRYHCLFWSSEIHPIFHPFYILLHILNYNPPISHAVPHSVGISSVHIEIVIVCYLLDQWNTLFIHHSLHCIITSQTNTKL